jgi:Uncharacterised nucleotidyltransferase
MQESAEIAMLDSLLETRIRKWRKAPRNFLALLQALQFHHADLEPLLRLDVTEWNALLSFSDRAHLTLQLCQLPSDVLPPWVAARIQANVEDNTKRIERIRAHYQEVAYVLQKVNAGHIVIKGFTQYPDYVRSLNLRMQSDIDIYCPPNTILCARDALREIGYESILPQKHVLLDHFPPMIRGWRWRRNFFDPKMSPAINLHYCLWNEQAARFDIPEVEQFWYRRVERDIEGFPCPVLSSVDHLAFCALHILRGLLRNDWVIHDVYELAYFLNSHVNDRQLWRNWHQVHSDSLRSLQAVSFCLARTWFGCAVSAEVKSEIDSLPVAVRQWFHCFSSSPLKRMFTPRHDGVWLHLALLGSAGAKLPVIRHGLLPARNRPLRIADQAPTIDRQVVKRRLSWPSIRYCPYVAARASFYWQVFVRSALAGLRWWCS